MDVSFPRIKCKGVAYCLFSLLFFLPFSHAQESASPDYFQRHPSKKESRMDEDKKKESELALKRILLVEKQKGKDHPDLARAMNRLALIYFNRGDYLSAKPLLQNALTIRENAFGHNHVEVASSLNNLGRLYAELGEYEKAQTVYTRALTIREKKLGPDHSEVAEVLNNLAYLYYLTGAYAKAEPLYTRALSIREKQFGTHHHLVVPAMNNLALLYDAIGDFQKAEILYSLALMNRIRAFGENHLDVATSLNNLANHYYILGKYEIAAPLFQKVLSVRIHQLGQDHPDVATSLNNLAAIHVLLGNLDTALSMYEKALAIRKKNLGEIHPLVADLLSNLAGIFEKKGNMQHAKHLYEKALSIRKQSIGEHHPDVADSYFHLAAFFLKENRYKKAHVYFKKGLLIENRLIHEVMEFTSEMQKMRFVKYRKRNLDAFLSLTAIHLKDNKEAVSDAFNAWIKRKGILMQNQKMFIRASSDADDPEVNSLFQDLNHVRAALSKLVFAGPKANNIEAFKKKMAVLEVRKNALEAELSRISSNYAKNRKNKTLNNWICVSGKLPEKAALIEFAQIENRMYTNGENAVSDAEKKYIAFVVTGGKEAGLQVFDLGNADTIHQEILRFKEEIVTRKILSSAQNSANRLYKLLFAPFEKVLSGTDTLFVSPDASVNLIPFEPLITDDGKFLVQRYSVNYLSTVRDLLFFGTHSKKTNPVVLFGNPNYDLEESRKRKTLSRLSLKVHEPEEASLRSVDMRGLRFEKLPGTREEVETICQVVGKEACVLYTGDEALEEVLREIRSPGILHLATHGFFLSDLTVKTMPENVLTRGILNPPEDNLATMRIENPLLRSGIALAGANNTLTYSNPEKSDGILTAEKILGLDLQDTRMVVLSGCKTGIGKTRAGEGVFGLRRAFFLAGAKSVVMSMWDIPDQETKELMVELYKNIKKGENRRDALRNAALFQMEKVKKRYGKAHPYYWAGFVFAGEP